MSNNITNFNPEVIEGLAANRPSPSNLKVGTFFVATDVKFISVVIEIAGVRSWIQVDSTADNTDKKAVVASSAGLAIPAYTTAAGVITETSNGALPAQDGITLIAGQRFLLQDGASAVDNGIYTVTSAGSAGTPFVLTRAADMLVGSPADGIVVFVEEGNLNGSQGFITTNVPGDIVGTAAIVWTEFSRSQVPVAPHYFVGGTGANNRNTGRATGSPLATTAEAYKRLGLTQWVGQPIVTVQGTVNEGVNPVLAVPPPIGGAQPILTQGIYTDSGFGVIPATGGSAGAINGSPLILMSVTSALTPAVDQFKGWVISFVSGPHAGQRAIIHTNDGAGTFSFTWSIIASFAPTNTDSFVLLNQTGKLTYTGNLTWLAQQLVLDGLAVDLDVSICAPGAWVQETACKWRNAGAGECNFGVSGCTWLSNPATAGQLFFASSIVTPCGSRFDGSSNGIQIGTMGAATSGSTPASGKMWLSGASFENCDFKSNNNTAGSGPFALGMVCCAGNNSGIINTFTGSSLDMVRVLASGWRKVSGFTAAIQLRECNASALNLLTMTGTLAGSNCCVVQQTNIEVNSCFGANPAAAANCFQLTGGSFSGNGVGWTGGTPGSDLIIDGDPAISWADVTTLGNGIITSQKGTILQFCGGMTQGAGATSAFLANTISTTLGTNIIANSATALANSVLRPRRFLRLRINVIQNSMDTTTTVALFINGADSVITIAVTAAATGALVDNTHTVCVADNGKYDLHISNPNATVTRTIQLAAVIEAV